MGQDEAMACIQTPHAREWARPESGVQFLPPFFLVGPVEPIEALVREANEAVGWAGEAATLYLVYLVYSCIMTFHFIQCRNDFHMYTVICVVYNDISLYSVATTFTCTRLARSYEYESLLSTVGV